MRSERIHTEEHAKCSIPVAPIFQLNSSTSSNCIRIWYPLESHCIFAAILLASMRFMTDGRFCYSKCCACSWAICTPAALLEPV